MFGTIVSAVASGLKALAIAVGWLKQSADQNTGRQLQAAADEQSTIKEATDGQKIDSSVAGLSGDALNDELRKSATP